MQALDVAGQRLEFLVGQFADYTARQLELFRDGMALGTGDHANSVMADVAAELTDEEIQALASYVQGLHARTPDAGATVAAQ